MPGIPVPKQVSAESGCLHEIEDSLSGNTGAYHLTTILGLLAFPMVTKASNRTSRLLLHLPNTTAEPRARGRALILADITVANWGRGEIHRQDRPANSPQQENKKQATYEKGPETWSARPGEYWFPRTDYA